jgi:hypothetical protein
LIEKPFNAIRERSDDEALISADEWSRIGRAVNIAHDIATGSPELVIAAIQYERAVKGTEGERGIITGMHALRSAAEAQARLADQAIERLQECARVVNDLALGQLAVDRTAG